MASDSTVERWRGQKLGGGGRGIFTIMRARKETRKWNDGVGQWCPRAMQ